MAGRIVLTKDNVRGKLKNEDNLVGDKLQVYLDDGRKMLIHPKNLTLIGYWD